MCFLTQCTNPCYLLLMITLNSAEADDSLLLFFFLLLLFGWSLVFLSFVFCLQRKTAHVAYEKREKNWKEKQKQKRMKPITLKIVFLILLLLIYVHFTQLLVVVSFVCFCFHFSLSLSTSVWFSLKEKCARLEIVNEITCAIFCCWLDRYVLLNHTVHIQFIAIVIVLTAVKQINQPLSRTGYDVWNGSIWKISGFSYLWNRLYFNLNYAVCIKSQTFNGAN